MATKEPQPGALGSTYAEAIHNAALSYAARGWPVFPLHSPTKAGGCTCGKPSCRDVGKHPRTKHGFKDASTDVEVIEGWWRKWPRMNLGLRTGHVSGFVVLDVDVAHDGIASLGELRRRYPRLSETASVLTGGGGSHLLFRHPGPDVLIPNTQQGVDRHGNRIGGLDGLPGLDVRGDGGYIVAAPSLHASGAFYQWENEAEIAELPLWLLELMRKKRQPPRSGPNPGIPRASPVAPGADAAEHWLGKALARAVPGQRDNVAYWLAQQLLWNGVANPESVMRRYAECAPVRVEDGDRYLPDHALRALASARKAPMREPARSEAALSRALSDTDTPIERAGDGAQSPLGAIGESTTSTLLSGNVPGNYHRTDQGNARRLVDRHGAVLRHVATWGKWLVWDGTRSRRDETGEHARLGKDTVRAMWTEVGDMSDRQDREDMIKWIMRSESEARLNAMLALAETEPEIAMEAEAFDRDGWLLNTRTGVVDLRSGEPRPHEPALLITKRAEVAYDPRAKAPMWERFLHTIFAENEELIAYVRRAVGYSLTGHTTEQCLFVLHGSGANGKSTFLEAVTRMLGDYAATTPMETLMVKRGQNIPSDVARLVGTRFVSASEAGDGRRLDEELVKRITGGDRMVARFMHKDWFEFTPVLKLWLAVNHRPTIRGTDNGIWRRIHLIPFAVSIPPERQDRHLLAKLAGEAAGILAWAVRGCLEWQREGLNPPSVVRQATRDYRADMDILGRYIEERLTTGQNLSVSAKQLRTDYEAWCAENGEHAVSQTKLGTTLGDRGFTRVRTNAGYHWRGVGLLDSPTQGELMAEMGAMGGSD